MAQTIKLRRSAVAGNRPTITQLDLGELAINTVDGKIYFEKSASGVESIQEIFTTNAINSGSLTTSGSITATSLSGNLDYTYLINTPTLVSSSSQLTSSYDNRYLQTSIFTPFSTSVDSRLLTNVDAAAGAVDAAAGAFASASLYSSSLASTINTLSTSVDSRLDTIELLNTTFATTGSNTFKGTQIISGSAYITQDLVVYGSSSVQNISASAVSIGTNTIILNTANPAIRFGGIKVIDSGSSASTGSLLWDSEHNVWLYQNPDGAGYASSRLIAGPKNTGTLGDETGLTVGYVPVAVGDDHIGNSIISASASSVTIGGNLNVTGTITGSFTGSAKVDYIIFSSSSAAPLENYMMQANTVDKTVDLRMGNNATLQMGQELYNPPIVNKSGEDLTDGTVVMIHPTSPAQGNRIAVVKCISDGTYLADRIVGVLTEDVANNQEGFATWFGYVRNISKTHVQPAGETWAEGDLLYTNPTISGALTNILPTAPNLKVTMGMVTSINGNNVTIMVKPFLRSFLGKLHNVLDTSTTTSYGDLLVKSGSVWKNTNQLTGSYSITGSLTATSLTGSLFGTATSASYSLTSSYGISNSSTSFNIGDTATYIGSVASTSIGLNTILNTPTGSYTSTFYKYTIKNGTNARAGEIMAVWNSLGTAEFTDNSTLDIGSTSAVTASVSIVSGQVILNFQTNTSGWYIKSMQTLI